MNERCSKCNMTFGFPAYEFERDEWDELHKLIPICPYCGTTLYNSSVETKKEESK